MPVVSPGSYILTKEGQRKVREFLPYGKVWCNDGQEWFENNIRLTKWKVIGTMVRLNSGLYVRCLAPDSYLSTYNPSSHTFAWSFMDKSVKYLNEYDLVARPHGLLGHKEDYILPYLPYQSGILYGRDVTFSEKERFRYKMKAPFNKIRAYLPYKIKLRETLDSIGEKTKDCHRWKTSTGKDRYFEWILKKSYSPYVIPLFGHVDFAIEWLAGVLDYFFMAWGPSNLDIHSFRHFAARMIHLVSVRCGYSLPANRYYDSNKKDDLLCAIRLRVPRTFIYNAYHGANCEYDGLFPRIRNYFGDRFTNKFPTDMNVLGVKDRVFSISPLKKREYMVEIDGPAIINGIMMR